MKAIAIMAERSMKGKTAAAAPAENICNQSTWPSNNGGGMARLAKMIIVKMKIVAKSVA
jgi:hypothetical protein